MKKIISVFDFEYNPDLKDLKSIYPMLRNSSFNMSLQTQELFLVGVVTINYVTKYIDFSVLNQNGELVQNKIACSGGINLLNYGSERGYFLEFLPSEGKFIFGREMLETLNNPMGGGGVINHEVL